MRRFWFPILAVAAAAVVSAAGCAGSKSTPAGTASAGPTPTVTLRGPGTAAVPVLTVTSSAFANGTLMPAGEAQIGCTGSNQSPDIAWTAGPPATKSYVVTEFDPDAPTGVGFWHWVLYNIPATTTTLALGVGTNPPTGTSGLNDYGALGYGGPCPPAGDGAHHYHFTVSALDTVLSGMPVNATGAFITFNSRGHILAQGTYLGLFAL
jgi:Raf kinase inhibitor-like YbhB/YbcL family protein